MAISDSRERAAGSSGFLFDRYSFILVVALLAIFGIVMIYSASSMEAIAEGMDASSLVVREVIYALMGVGCAYVAAHVDYHVWAKRLVIPMTAFIIVLLCLVHTPLAGHEVNGSARWIALGPLTLQPSELAKPLIIVIAADIIQEYIGDSVGDPKPYLKRILMYIFLPLALIAIEPDKGTCVILAATIFVMMVVAGLRKRYVFGMIGIGAVGLVFVMLTSDYVRQRLNAFLDPWGDPSGNSFQIVEGIYALARGGLFGVGLGLGRQKYDYLPFAHSDYIYAVIGEELGLAGAVAVLLLFFALLFFGYRIARSAPDLMGKLVSVGCSSLLVIQMLVNVGGVTKVIPLSGKPIPFISYGGSSILASFILAGLVLSVSRAGEMHGGVAPEFVVHEGRGASRFRLFNGGASATPSASRTPDAIRASRQEADKVGSGRISYNANGTKRITLGPGAGERLRGRDRK